MEFDNRKKLLKVKWLFLAEIIITLAFFACIMAALSCVAEYYARVPYEHRLRPLFSQPIPLLDYSWQIFFLIVGVALLILSRFEIKLLTADNKRFLGYKAYILFYYKVLYLPASLGMAVLTSLCISAGYNVFVPMQLLLVLPYYVLLALFTFKYRDCLGEYVFLSYLQSVKDWWTEGKLVSSRPRTQKKEIPHEKAGAERALPHSRFRKVHTEDVPEPDVDADKNIDGQAAAENISKPATTSEPATAPESVSAEENISAGDNSSVSGNTEESGLNGADGKNL